jgi:hypothetical protein
MAGPQQIELLVTQSNRPNLLRMRVVFKTMSKLIQHWEIGLWSRRPSYPRSRPDRSSLSSNASLIIANRWLRYANAVTSLNGIQKRDSLVGFGLIVCWQSPIRSNRAAFSEIQNPIGLGWVQRGDK